VEQSGNTRRQSLFLTSFIKGTGLGCLPLFLTKNSWLQFNSTASIIQGSGSKWDEVGTNGGPSTQGTQYRLSGPVRAKGERQHDVPRAVRALTR
jgi:hypothetical protein